MSKNANELITSLEEGGTMQGLSVKVSAEQKACINDLRKKTGLRPSEIVGKALDSFFEGYEVDED